MGEPIGINVRDPSKIEAAQLTDIQAGFFTVFLDRLSYHIPYASILRVISAPEGVTTGGLFSKQQYRLVIKLFDLVVYKGAVGFGVSVPLSDG